MIKIGVSENIFLSKVEKNDKGTLSVTFTESAAGVKEVKKLSLMDQGNESSDSSGSNAGSTQFLLFMPSREYQGKVSEPEKLLQAMIDFKNQLTHILKRYATLRSVKWDVWKGLSVKTDEDLLRKIAEEASYKQVYDNIVDQFIAMSHSLKVEDPAKLSRLLLVRQSAEKHYGRLRDKFLDDQPFLEDMQIPKESSKLWSKAGSKGATKLFDPTEDGYVPNFTAYEIKNGKDNPIQSASTPENNAAEPEEAAVVEGLFGSGESNEPVTFGMAESEEK